MQIELPDEAIKLLQEILPILSDAADTHDSLNDDQEIIEPWTPTDWDSDISCPDLTVGVLKKAERVRKLLKM